MGHLTSPQFRRRQLRRMLAHNRPGGTAPLGTLTAYQCGEMGRRSKTESRLTGPVNGGWMWSHRVSVVCAVHDALRASSDLDFLARENVAMSIIKMMPMAPEEVYWNTKDPTYRPLPEALDRH